VREVSLNSRLFRHHGAILLDADTKRGAEGKSPAAQLRMFVLRVLNVNYLPLLEWALGRQQGSEACAVMGQACGSATARPLG
jgi:hypothetical protein